MSNITKAIAALGVVASLGVTALPLSTYAVETPAIPVKVEVDSTLSITTDKSEIDLGAVMPNGPIATSTINITVTDNEGDGSYNLTVHDADDKTGLYLNGDTTETTNVIPAATSSAGVEKGKTAWGYRLKGETAFTGVVSYTDPDNDNLGTIKTATPDEEADGDDAPYSGTTAVEFGVSVGTDIADGTYTGAVVFIATAA